MKRKCPVFFALWSWAERLPVTLPPTFIQRRLESGVQLYPAELR